MKHFKFLSVVFLSFLIVFSSSVVVFATDEEVTQVSVGEGGAEDYLANCRIFANLLVSDGVLTSSDFFYICYDKYARVYNAWVCSDEFYFESENPYVYDMRDGSYYSTSDHIPLVGNIGRVGWLDGRNFFYGSGYKVVLTSSLYLYSSSDLQTYATTTYPVMNNPFLLYPQIGSSNMTFRSWGCVYPEPNWEDVQSVSFSYPYVFSNIVPILKIRDTDVAVTIDGLLTVHFSDIEESSDFFQIAHRIPFQLGIVLDHLLPVGVLILTVLISLLLARFLGRFFRT